MTESKLRQEPERPDLPILGMSLDAWGNHYERPLSEWFYTTHGRHAASIEWDPYVALMFDLQLRMESEK